MTYDPKAFVVLPVNPDAAMLKAATMKGSRKVGAVVAGDIYHAMREAYTESEDAHVQPTDYAEDQKRRNELLKELDELLTGPGTGAMQPRLADIVGMVRTVVHHEGKPLMSIARYRTAHDAHVAVMKVAMQGEDE